MFIARKTLPYCPRDPGDVYDIFICHSFWDPERALAIKGHLEAEGLKVYIDWIDDRVDDPREMAEHLALKLKMAMRCSTRMLYLHTPNTGNSRWCAWEIGYFDAIKPGRILVDYAGPERLPGYLGTFRCVAV